MASCKPEGIYNAIFPWDDTAESRLLLSTYSLYQEKKKMSPYLSLQARPDRREFWHPSLRCTLLAGKPASCRLCHSYCWKGTDSWPPETLGLRASLPRHHLTFLKTMYVMVRCTQSSLKWITSFLLFYFFVYVIKEHVLFQFLIHI